MRFVFSFLLLFTLASCNFNVTPTFYVRDVQDVISDNKAIDIPIFLKYLRLMLIVVTLKWSGAWDFEHSRNGRHTFILQHR